MDYQDKDEEGSAEGGDTDEDREPAEGNSQWGWISCVDAVSETCRCSWDEVWHMSVIEFLNLLCYRKDKLEREKRQMEKWRKTH